MYRVASAVALPALVLFTVAPAAAQDGSAAPDAARVRKAADEFDAAVAAYNAKDYATAASHFEAADSAVPSAKSIRQALRARLEAGQKSRAATLAAQAFARYPSDESTTVLARETLSKVTDELQKVVVRCAQACVLSVGTRAIPGEANTRWVVYLDPGPATISASFANSGTSAHTDVVAKAGGSASLRFDLPSETSAPPPTLTAPVEPDPLDAHPENSKKADRSGISPAYFYIAAGATAVTLGVTIWSGVDALNNPGTDAVRAQCAGLGPNCPAYQTGLSNQNRTNALVGATVGAAALSVTLALFTRWNNSKPKPSDQSSLHLAPLGAVTHEGVVLGLGGAF